MVYNTLVLPKMTVQESTELDIFLEEFIQESQYSDISRKIRELASDLKNGNATKEDIKEVYDEITSLPAGDQPKAYVALAFALIACVGIMFGFAFAENLPVGLTLYAISIISLIISNIVLSKAQVDTVYNNLMKEEAVAMKNLRIAKNENNSDAINFYEKVIEACEGVKKKRREVLNARATGTKLEESADLLLEYQGNEIKNNIFIQVLTDVDNLVKYFLERIAIIDESVDKMLALASKSTKANISKNYMEMVSIGRGMNDEFSKAKDVYGPMTWSQLKSQVKKFNNKYSEMSMTQREALDKKMNTYLEKLNKYAEKYNDKDKIAKERSILDKCRALDGGTAAQITDLIYDWINYLINEIKYTTNDVLTVIQDLNVDGIKSSLIYNILNKNKSNLGVKRQ